VAADGVVRAPAVGEMNRRRPRKDVLLRAAKVLRFSKAGSHWNATLPHLRPLSTSQLRARFGYWCGRPRVACQVWGTLDVSANGRVTGNLHCSADWFALDRHRSTGTDRRYQGGQAGRVESQGDRPARRAA